MNASSGFHCNLVLCLFFYISLSKEYASSKCWWIFLALFSFISNFIVLSKIHFQNPIISRSIFNIFIVRKYYSSAFLSFKNKFLISTSVDEARQLLQSFRHPLRQHHQLLCHERTQQAATRVVWGAPSRDSLGVNWLIHHIQTDTIFLFFYTYFINSHLTIFLKIRLQFEQQVIFESNV